MTGKLYLAPTLLFIFIQGFFGVYGAAAPKEEVLKVPDKRFLSLRVMPAPESAFIEEGGQVKSPVIHSFPGMRSLTAPSPQDHVTISVLEEDHLPTRHPKHFLRRQNARTLEDESEHAEASRKIWTRDQCYNYIKKEIGVGKSNSLNSAEVKEICERFLRHLSRETLITKTIHEKLYLGLNQRLREITPQKEFTWGPNDIWMNWAELISLGLGIAQVYLPIFPQNDNQLPLATALALSPIALTWIWKMGAFAQQKLSNCLCSKRAYLSSETHKRNQRILEDQCRLISLILLFRNREYLGDPDQGKLIERMINCAREVISKWPQTPSFFASLFVDERLSIDYDFDLPRELCEP